MSDGAMIDMPGVFDALQTVRANKPLVQNITNFVAMASSANLLLALGASPAMVHSSQEAAEFTGLADALVINIGTLSPTWVDSMKQAAVRAVELNKPFILDPVAAGATAYRGDVAKGLLALRPTIVRGNASEIISLTGVSGSAGKGVDSTAASNEALAAAQTLANESGAVVAVTGAIDYVTDGERTVSIAGGHALMPLSTALGCGLTACTAAFATVRPPFEATVAALAVYAAAGAIAGQRCAETGPGYLPAEMCNALYQLDLTQLEAHATIGDQTS